MGRTVPTHAFSGISAQGRGPSLGGPVLDIRHLSKTFPGTRALNDVSLTIGQGEIHALVGQNGSGKSTLIKVLAGYHEADEGSEAWLNGEPLNLNNSTFARPDGLRFVHQDLGLISEFSAIENLALRGRYLRRAHGLIDWRQHAEQTHALLTEFDVHLDIHRPLSEATPVQRTIVAIAAALAGWQGGPGLLVLDEPTAALPPREVDHLLATVQQLRSRGTSVLYVSHRLDELFRIADRVTVLRGGSVVSSRALEGLNTRTLAALMIGKSVESASNAAERATQGSVVLEAREVTGKFLDNVAFELRRGEVVGLAGLPGSGSAELPYALSGQSTPLSGQIRLGGGPWRSLRRRRQDFPLVPADRAREAVIAEFQVGENLSLSMLGSLRKFRLLSRSREESFIDSWMEHTEIKAGSSKAAIGSLSGGNQQKVVVARCLARDPQILMLCEPTAGVDIGTREAIYELVLRRVDEGMAVIVSSSDAGDLLAMCGRVLVFVDGRISCELAGSDLSEAAIVHAMETEIL